MILMHYLILMDVDRDTLIKLGLLHTGGSRFLLFTADNTAPPQPSPAQLLATFFCFSSLCPWRQQCLMHKILATKVSSKEPRHREICSKVKANQHQNSIQLLSFTVFEPAVRFYCLPTAMKAVFSSSGLPTFINITPAINCSCTEITHQFWIFKMFPIVSSQKNHFINAFLFPVDMCL